MSARIDTPDELADWLRGAASVPGSQITDSLIRFVRSADSMERAVQYLLTAGFSQSRIRNIGIDPMVLEQVPATAGPQIRPINAEQDRILDRAAALEEINQIEDEDERAAAVAELAQQESAIASVVPDNATPLGPNEAGNERYEIDGRQFVMWNGQLYPDFDVEEDDDGPRFLGGFPEDYSVSSEYWFGSSSWQRATEERTPQYYEWDEYNNFAGKDAAYQRMAKDALLAAGLISEDEHRIRGWHKTHADAMRYVMVSANGAGRQWNEIAEEMALAREEEGEGPGPLAGRRLTLDAYREPDYASLSQAVKQLFRNQLRRDPLDWEMSLLANQLQTDYRSAYDADVEAATANFEAENHAIVQADDASAPVVTQADPVAAVDPVSRLREAFEQKYAPELQLGEDRQQGMVNLQGVMNALTQTANVLGSGVL